MIECVHSSAWNSQPSAPNDNRQAVSEHIAVCSLSVSRTQPRFKQCGRDCPSFLPVPTNVQLQRSKASRGEEWGGGADCGVWGSVVSSRSGIWGGFPAANDFGAFRVQFCAISLIFCAFNSCLKWEICTSRYWL